MPHATLTVDVHETTLGPFGADEIEFCFAANPGSPARPLQKAASGGYSSRQVGQILPSGGALLGVSTGPTRARTGVPPRSATSSGTAREVIRL